VIQARVERSGAPIETAADELAKNARGDCGRLIAACRRIKSGGQETFADRTCRQEGFLQCASTR
jgi:hypothetical protein